MRNAGNGKSTFVEDAREEPQQAESGSRRKKGKCVREQICRSAERGSWDQWFLPRQTGPQSVR